MSGAGNQNKAAIRDATHWIGMVKLGWQVMVVFNVTRNTSIRAVYDRFDEIPSLEKSGIIGIGLIIDCLG